MKIVRIILVLIILLLVGLVAFLYKNQPTLEAVDPNDNTKIIVSVEEGTLPNQFFNDLQEQDIIRSSEAVTEYFISKDYNLYVGSFQVSRSMSGDEIADYLSDVNNVETGETITVIEGATLEDIAQSFSEVTNHSSEQYLQYWSDAGALNNFINDYEYITDEILDEDIKYPLEGYFAPATYPITEDESIEDITNDILTHSNRVYSQYLGLNTENNMSFHEVLTLASIVERETISDSDKPIVARVFLNRLENTSEYGYLQSDITVLYALGEHKEQVLYVDLEVDDPYNTYLYSGLTPGPIASPSIASIEAVYNPDENDYYFFFADSEGKIYYSETLDQHNEIVNQNR